MMIVVIIVAVVIVLLFLLLVFIFILKHLFIIGTASKGIFAGRIGTIAAIIAEVIRIIFDVSIGYLMSAIEGSSAGVARRRDERRRRRDIITAAMGIIIVIIIRR